MLFEMLVCAGDRTKRMKNEDRVTRSFAHGRKSDSGFSIRLIDRRDLRMEKERKISK